MNHRYAVRLICLMRLSTVRLQVNEHQRTSIPGLYAAGDVVHALNQTSIGTAHGATAATAIHHELPRNYR